MNYRCLSQSKKVNETTFYLAALKYGHYLWLQGHAGRGILALTRALYADLPQGTTVLDQWPLPYAALKWMVASHPNNHFPGNPRISFQHQATRLQGARKLLRRSRAWAVWALVRKAKPTLPADSLQVFEEPTINWIETQLHDQGHMNEATLWRTTLETHFFKE